ncbi:protein of unknown function [Candidatus Methylomirabilis oxygeniifera]|uniref:Uncharacterized protein n=1 Tax=Methylomirabilis oxygeniifera TaxID=671143 RepID=D5MIE6_METO1|nr:protein of unknown function [Candidatus Methylomirabilis oxyfera]
MSVSVTIKCNYKEMPARTVRVWRSRWGMMWHNCCLNKDLEMRIVDDGSWRWVKPFKEPIGRRRVTI